VESARADHQHMAQEIISRLLESPPAGTYRIGITGAPGAGKKYFHRSARYVPDRTGAPGCCTGH
jgi:putative protein kinase ArgK-like GTPase of G3E family